MNNKSGQSAIASFLLLLVAMTASGVWAAESYTPPQTEFGVPDLQGVWNYKTRTSLERPDVYEGALEVDEATMIEKMMSTSQYIAALEAVGAEAPGPDNVGAYNGFWITPGDTLALMNGMYRTSLIVDPPNGKIPWTEEGQAVRRTQRDTEPMGVGESDGPEGRTLSDRCLVSFSSTAPFMSSLYNNHVQIVQSPTHAVLLAEMAHDARIVPIDQDFRELPFAQWLGQSVGYYEDDTLVVVTRDFHPWQIAKEQMKSENLTLTERFTRVAENKLHYSFTIDDPELYTQPWTGELPMYTGEDLYEYACHEGNYSMKAILAGARTAEINPSTPDQ